MCQYFQSPVKIRTRQQSREGKGPDPSGEQTAAWMSGKYCPLWDPPGNLTSECNLRTDAGGVLRVAAAGAPGLGHLQAPPRSAPCSPGPHGQLH